ncbi:MAG TPA: inositol monophosphatase family protein, partial [Casimicrobiaceae bacterium]|nr:inositol monophosphatase family protein [Casimicrobiaceae bacterium]
GAGAYLNDQRIRVSRRSGLKAGLIGTGFPFRQLDHLETYLAILRDVMKSSTGVRRAGSAALDLAYVAAGRLDGFWEFGLGAWDIAAGALLVNEAGGRVGDFAGGHDYMRTNEVIAAAPGVFNPLREALATADLR